VLPACSHFEHDDLSRLRTHWLQRAEPVIPPQGEALPNTEIFRRLAARFGFDDPIFKASDAELMAMPRRQRPRLGGVRPSRLPLDRALLMRFDGAEAKSLRQRVPENEIGQGRARPRRTWRRSTARGSPITGRSPVVPADPHHARLGQADDVDVRPAARPTRRRRRWRSIRTTRGSAGCATACACGLERSRECACPARDGRGPPGVVCSLKGAWMKPSDNGQTVSALAPTHHADICGGACYNDTRVEVAPA